jgi:pyruvate formate lyase activating enzyme
LIFDIRRFTVHDGPGIRTTVFFKGCPMSCWWCHNPESQCFRTEEYNRPVILDNRTFLRNEIMGKWMTVEEVMTEIEKDRVFYDESQGGVTFSGGEPLLQDVFLEEMLDLSKEAGMLTTLDTSGYADETVFRRIMDKPDLFLFDIKLLDEEEHKKYTGVSNRDILANLNLLCERENNVTLRFPVVPGITDTPANIDALKDLLSKVKNSIREIDLLPFHSIAAGKYKKMNRVNKTGDLRDVTKNELEVLKKELEEPGVTVKIGG